MSVDSEISQNAPAIEKIIEEWWEEHPFEKTRARVSKGYDENQVSYVCRNVSLRVSKEASLRELEKINEEADRMYGKGSLVSEFIVHYRQRRELERPTKT